MYVFYILQHIGIVYINKIRKCFYVYLFVTKLSCIFTFLSSNFENELINIFLYLPNTMINYENLRFLYLHNLYENTKIE